MSPNEDKNEYENNGLCFNKFKESLGKRGALMSDEEIRKMMDLQWELADILFESWGQEEKTT